MRVVGGDRWVALERSERPAESRPAAASGDSAKRERKGLHAVVEELDFEHAIRDGLGLANQLIQPVARDTAVALFINVRSVRCARRLAVDEDAESHRNS